MRDETFTAAVAVAITAAVVVSISGGYEDDIDMGKRIYYCGEGAPASYMKHPSIRLSTLPAAGQVTDQKMKGTNAALQRSFAYQIPIRVLRKYSSHSAYSPQWYDQ